MSDTKLKPTAKKPATRKPAPHAPELSKDDVYLFGIGMWETVLLRGQFIVVLKILAK